MGFDIIKKNLYEDNNHFNGVLLANKSDFKLHVVIASRYLGKFLKTGCVIEPGAESTITYSVKGNTPFKLKIYDSSDKKHRIRLWHDHYVNHWYRLVISGREEPTQIFKACTDIQNRNALSQREEMLRFVQCNNFYEVLNVDRHASQEEIRKAYYQLAKDFHPDRNQHSETNVDSKFLFQRILEAYLFLCDEDRRRDYDNLLAHKEDKLKALVRDIRRRDMLKVTGVVLVAGIGCMLATAVVVFTGGVASLGVATAIPVMITMAALSQGLMSAGIFGAHYLLKEQTAITGGDQAEFTRKMIASAGVGAAAGAVSAGAGGAIASAIGASAVGTALNSVQLGALTGATTGATAGMFHAGVKNLVDGAFLHEFEGKTNTEVAIAVLKDMIIGTTIGAVLGATVGAIKGHAMPGSQQTMAQKGPAPMENSTTSMADPVVQTKTLVFIEENAAIIGDAEIITGNTTTVVRLEVESGAAPALDNASSNLTAPSAHVKEPTQALVEYFEIHEVTNLQPDMRNIGPTELSFPAADAPADSISYFSTSDLLYIEYIEESSVAAAAQPVIDSSAMMAKHVALQAATTALKDEMAHGVLDITHETAQSMCNRVQKPTPTPRKRTSDEEAKKKPSNG